MVNMSAGETQWSDRVAKDGSLNAVSEDHDQSWLEEHLFAHMRVVAAHDHHCLSAGNPSAKHSCHIFCGSFVVSLMC